MFKFVNNPFDVIMYVINKLYPFFEADIIMLEVEDFLELTNGENGWGVTSFIDGKKPLITFRADLPCFAFMEIVAHEVAHVIAGVDAGHGKLWEQEFEKINKEYIKVVEN